jgi:hypothetical protein
MSVLLKVIIPVYSEKNTGFCNFKAGGTYDYCWPSKVRP